MTLLREIQDAASDSEIDITHLLRKCIVLAARLGNKELNKWAHQELTGYEHDEKLPDYRIIRVQPVGSFTNGKYQATLDVPLLNIPEEFHDGLTHQYFRDPISSLAYLIENNKQFINCSWPADFTALIGMNIYQGYTCLGIWRPVSCSSIKGIIDNVRTRILEFAIEIEKESPDAGEALPGMQPIASDKVTYIFNTTINGNVGGFTAFSSDIIQNIHQEVYQEDMESLKKYLSKIGITPIDQKELEIALDLDKAKIEEGILGDYTKGWIDKAKDKVSWGSEKVGPSVAANLIAKGILSYLGFT